MSLKKYFNEIKVSKTLLLSPKTQNLFIKLKSVAKKDVLKFYRSLFL